MSANTLGATFGGSRTTSRSLPTRSQFRNATVIVASPPCQAYSYRAMPWKRAKALPPPDNTLFDACFRIQREACEAAGRHIPLIVENVRGAQKWVGKAHWQTGSFVGFRSLRRMGKPWQTRQSELAKMKPGFKAGGTVTAGNASGLNDAASALVLATAVAHAQTAPDAWIKQISGEVIDAVKADKAIQAGDTKRIQALVVAYGKRDLLAAISPWERMPVATW